MRALLTPRMLAAHLLGLICVAVAAGFGVWQLDAWQARRDAEQRDLTQLAPVPLPDVLGNDDPFPGDRVGQPVEVTGTWLPEATVLIADRPQQGQEGWWVVTPLSDGDPGDPAVPVVRGWTDDLDDVPAPPEGEGAVVGWAQPSEGTGAVDDDPTDDILPQLRTADLVQRVDRDLYGAYVVVDPDRSEAVASGSEGLEAAELDALPEVGVFTALRNLLYGIEWFVFAAFAAFIWWRFVRDELTDRRRGGDDAGAAPAAEEEAGDPVGSTT